MLASFVFAEVRRIVQPKIISFIAKINIIIIFTYFFDPIKFIQIF